MEKTAAGITRKGRRPKRQPRYQSTEPKKKPRLVTREIAIDREARKLWMIWPGLTLDECKRKVIEWDIVKIR